ncbi:protocadherin beta-12-like, partial [Stylophora pistillata]|uniref:protocadherin beta-12-like n=1 Tax=Stylophora pistillata TaxID=50429 RepID=UPI000C04861D
LYTCKDVEIFLTKTRRHEHVDTVLVRILVKDVNDNSPVFYEQRYKKLLTEIPEPKTVVAQVTAFDRDSGINSELEYFIVSGSDSHFRIGEKTGAVSTSGSKNLKSQNLRLFNIRVSVSDYGNPPRKAKRQARLSVLVFFPLRSPLILIETTDTTMTVRFDLKDMARSNIAKYGIIVQEFVDNNNESLPQPKAAFQKEARKNYDAVVYSVGTALVLVIILAFLRGFYRLKLDRKRIHEEKKKRISFPMSNPRFQEPNSPVEKIKTPGPAKKMVAVNLDKGSEFSHRDEDEGSSPDSALDESTRPLQSRRRPTLQEVRLKKYFNSVESSSCASCDHVKIYCVQETVT